MKTRRTIKGTSIGGVVEEAYTPSNPPPYPVVEDGSYLTLGAGYLATQMKITATSSASVGWHKFVEIQYTAAQLNNTYSAILLVNGLNATQQAVTQNNKSESGEIEIDFYKAVNEDPIQIAISVLSGNINLGELCAALDTANSKICLYMYFNQYQAITYSLLSEEQTYSEKYAELVFVSEYHGTTAPDGAIYAVVRNNASELNGKAVSDIFESDGVTAKKATNVTTNINGKAISSIFESNGTTVKNATNAVVAGKLKNVKTATEWESENPVLDAGEFGYDSTYNRVKVGDGSTAWKALASLATSRFTFGTAAWGDIARISENGEAKKYFNVGDEKTIELSTGEVITVVILGFDHDYLKNGGKAGITIGMKNLLATKYPMNNTVVNNIEWKNSLMRTSTMATLLSQLPSDLQNVIKIVTKRMLTSGTSSISTEDKLFLFSEVEIYGTGRGNEGEQYEYWKTVKDGTVEADRIKYLSNGSGSADGWWLRSLSPMPALFACVSSGGEEVYGEANNEEGVSFGFCV